MSNQTCTGCGMNLPLNRDHFGSTPSGGFRKKCRKCMAAHTKAYDAANPEKRNARNESRLARGGHAEIDLHQKQRLISRQQGYCLCCGERIQPGQQLELDHVVPIVKGGTHDEKNLAMAHAKCNMEKHSKTLEEHWAWRARVGLPFKRFKLLQNGTWIIL